MKKLVYQKNENFKRSLFLFLAVFFLVFLDQITKFFFREKIDLFFFKINPIKNTGSSFSIFSDVSFYNLFIIFLSLFVLILAIFFLIKNSNFLKNEIYIFSTIFFFSGILGNLIDRIIFGAVRDFFLIPYFAIINFADVYLTLFAILLMIDIFKKDLLK